MENIEDEFADVLIYSLLLAHDLKIDVNKIIKNKIKKNEKKYPVDNAYGVRTKYTNL